jgi:hypothetical protein
MFEERNGKEFISSDNNKQTDGSNRKQSEAIKFEKQITPIKN